MATIHEDFRTYLLASADVKRKSQGRISQNELPPVPLLPYIWFQKSGEDPERDLTSSGITPGFVHYAVECVGQSPTAACELAELVQARCESGGPVTFGTRTCNVFCDAPGDDWEPRPGGPGANGFHVAALTVDVWRQS